MGKYPKNLRLYREYNAYLASTDLIQNLEILRNMYISENYKRKIGDSKYGNNFFTAKALEYLREVIIWSDDSNTLSTNISTNTTNFVNGYLNFKDVVQGPWLKKINKLPGGVKGNILFNLAHKQFWYQNIEFEYKAYCSNYLEYYNLPIISKYIEDQFGITYERLLFLCSVFYFRYQSDYRMNFDSKDNLYPNELNLIKKHFSISLPKLRDKLIQVNKKANILNDFYELETYGMELLHQYPLIEVDGNYICPFPVMLINRVTESLYYDFDERFKQKHLGNINEDFFYGIFQYLNAENYEPVLTRNFKHLHKRNSPPNPDIIIKGEGILFFIESKTNCLSIASKNSEDILERDKERIKKNIIQIYKSTQYYVNMSLKDGYFGVIKESSNEKIIPIISYISQPYLSMGGYVELLLSDLRKNGEIDKDFTPYIIANSCVPLLTEVLNHITTLEFIEYMGSEDFMEWDFERILREIMKRHNIKYSLPLFKNMSLLLDKEEKNIKHLAPGES